MAIKIYRNGTGNKVDFLYDDYYQYIYIQLINQVNMKINKYGLPRTIPPDIKRIIRRDAGYGCVVCGSLIYQYEHIHPVFAEAKDHDPEKMTLLCPRCHDNVTKKRWSKNKIWKAKKNPKTIIDGFSSNILEPSNYRIIRMGSNTFNELDVILILYGKPILWMESPHEIGEPILINAIFNDIDGKCLGYINRNEFIALNSGADIESIGSRIKIRPKPRKIALSLNYEGDEPIKIERIEMSYLNCSIVLNNNGFGVTIGNSPITYFKDINISGGFIGFKCGDVICTREDNLGIVKKLRIALHINYIGEKIYSFDGFHIGWVLRNTVVNRKYDFVGYITKINRHENVFNLNKEFIGYLIDSNGKKYIEMNNFSHESNEPIWINPKERATKNIKATNNIDVSYRLFGIKIYNKLQSKSYGEIKKDISSKSYKREVGAIVISDRVIIDFQGYLDGEIFEGGSANNFSLIVGNQRMIPGFESSLIGKKVGDNFNIDLFFPDNYHVEYLQNREVCFSIFIKEVERYK